jgi:hypothetical protein
MGKPGLSRKQSCRISLPTRKHAFCWRARAADSLGIVILLYTLAFLRGSDGAITTSSLAFSPARVGVGCEISVSFTSDAAFSAGDEVTLELPDFGSGLDAFSPTVLSEQPFRAASWSPAVNGSSETLVFTATAAIPADTQCILVVPQDQFIQLPASGIRAGSTSFTITTGGASASIGAVPPVGSFRASTALSFTPRYTVAPVAIAVDFQPAFDIANGETVSLTLASFSRGGDSSLTLSVSSGSFATSATWSEAAGTLTLTASGANAAGSAVSLSVPSASGLLLPSTGIPSACSSLLISSTAADGPVRPTPHNPRGGRGLRG